MPNFAIGYLQLLEASRQVSSLELRQIRMLYESAHPTDSVPRIETSEGLAKWESCSDPALVFLLALLFAELHRGSVLLVDRKEGRKAEESALEFMRLCKELMPEQHIWDEPELRTHATALLDQAREASSTKSLPCWLMQAEAELPNAAVQPIVIGRPEGWSLQRLYVGERNIRTLLMQRLQHIQVPQESLQNALHDVLVAQAPRLSNGQVVPLDIRQVVAMLVACQNLTTVISGGPGTGKTTVVTQVLRTLLRIDSTLCAEQIALAAPTGRAAARMQESIAQSLGANPSEIDASLQNLRGRTLHSLLGYNGHTGAFMYNAANPLPYRLVVVDESSMIDLHFFGQFLSALDSQCRLVLLGDRDQLPSVDAGAVLGDITNEAYADIERGSLSAKGLAQLSPYLGALGFASDASLLAKQSGHPLEDHMVVLTKSHRFHGPIGALAQAVASGQASAVASVLQASHAEVCINHNELDVVLDSWQQAHYPAEWMHIAREAFVGFASATILQESSDAFQKAKSLLTMQDSNRILCPVKQDKRGAELVNQKMSERLGGKAFQKDYAGLPVIIGQNAPVLGLFNGDTGVLVQTRDGLSLLVKGAFGYRFIPRAVLPDYAPAFAMTVHKSQGSEYAHVLLMLPEKDSAILTREILFTAVTRTKLQFTIAGWNDMLAERWLRRTIHRASGLMDRVI